jgi:hypothetical protein
MLRSFKDFAEVFLASAFKALSFRDVAERLRLRSAYSDVQARSSFKALFVNLKHS